MSLHSLPIPGRLFRSSEEAAMYMHTHTHGCLSISFLGRLETGYFEEYHVLGHVLNIVRASCALK